MELTLIIIASLVLLTQFFIDFVISNKKLKIKVGIGVLLCGLLSIWLAFIVQGNERVNAEIVHSNEIKDQKESFKRLDSSYKVLEIELRIRNNDLVKIKNQNDSLNNSLLQMTEKQDQTLEFTKFSANEVNKSRVAIENLGYKQISRRISEKDKIDMIRILKIHKGSKVKISTILGDSEALQFAIQVKEIFEAADWKVGDISQLMINNDVIHGVIIRIKSENYPIRVNVIFESFKMIKMIAEVRIDNRLAEDEVQIWIGAK